MNKYNNIKYTVVTVTYNCITTIERTIKSVIAQTYDNLEYIIIDGQSEDGTVDIISKYQEFLSFFVSEPDSGIYDAMNKAIAHATGDYLIFMNGDDYFYGTDVFQRISGYCTGENIVIGQEYFGSRVSEIPDMSDGRSPFYGIFYPHQATFSPMKTYREIGVFDLDYKISADFEWMCRAIDAGIKVDWVPEIVSVYTIGGVSAGLKCMADEISISKRYLQKNGQEKLIYEMINNTKDRAKGIVMRTMMSDDSYQDYVRYVYKDVLKLNSEVQLWGAGFVADYYIDSLNNNDISVNCVIDKGSNKEDIEGVPVVRYSPELITQLLVASEAFDDEICDFLSSERFKEYKDFLNRRFDKIRRIYREQKNRNEGDKADEIVLE